MEQYEELQETLPISFFVGKTSEIIELADCAIMVSGSVSLEMLARRTPATVVYRTTWPTYCIGKMLVTCKYMSLPNLIARRTVMPEFLSVGNPAPVTDSVVEQVHRWLSDPRQLAEARRELDEIRQQIYVTGATRRTAEVILRSRAA
jgi:lipid-A-disaccharide synthase